jgi:hypothetical protein
MGGSRAVVAQRIGRALNEVMATRGLGDYRLGVSSLPRGWSNRAWAAFPAATDDNQLDGGAAASLAKSPILTISGVLVGLHGKVRVAAEAQ